MSPQQEYIIDLPDLLKFVIHKKLKIVMGGLIGLLLGLFVFLTQIEVYQTTTLVKLSNNNKNGLSSSITNNLGTISKLAGISLARPERTSAEIIATLKSRKFSIDFIRKYELESSIIPNSQNNFLSNYLKSIQEKKPKPFQSSEEKLYKAFTRKTLDINQDRKSGLIVLTVNAFSKNETKYIAEKLVTELNLHFQLKAISESQNAIDYLEDKATKIPNAEIKRNLYNLMESHLQELALANSKKDFALETIDPPYIPEDKHSPKAINLLPIGAFLGLFFSLTLILISYFKMQFTPKNKDFK